MSALPATAIAGSALLSVMSSIFLERFGRKHVEVSVMDEEEKCKLSSAVAGRYGIRRGARTHHSRSHGPRVLLP